MEKRIDESDKSTTFDPDTIERNLNKRSNPQQENAKGQQIDNHTITTYENIPILYLQYGLVFKSA